MGACIVVMLAALFETVSMTFDSQQRSTSIGKNSGDSIDMETTGGLHMFEVLFFLINLILLK